MAEQHNELLRKNHQSRPTRTEPFLEMNVISSQTNERGRSHGCGRGHGRGRGRNSRYHGTHGNNSTNKGKTSMHHQKWNNIEAMQDEKHALTDPLPSDRKSIGNSTVTSQPSSFD